MSVIIIKACEICAGIGLGIALKYLSEGDDVVLVGRSLERLQSAIPKDFVAKGKVLYLAKDVSTVCNCTSPTPSDPFSYKTTISKTCRAFVKTD